ncbi:hypothetical protein GCM10023203_51920 [Actinomycetospora straminea]|uniref:Uncharacterized protein n=1 Tax=Actinomycetospora straminea TaxID=663607 RepID=A0ABP9F3B8_9PSEU
MLVQQPVTQPVDEQQRGRPHRGQAEGRRPARRHGRQEGRHHIVQAGAIGIGRDELGGLHGRILAEGRRTRYVDVA